MGQRPRLTRKLLYEMVEKGTPVKDRVFGDGSYLRPNFDGVADGNVVKYFDGLSLRNVRVDGKLITAGS